MDELAQEVAAELAASAVSYTTVYKSGEMPVIKWDSAFEEFIDRRGNLVEEMQQEKTHCLFPWQIELYLPEEYRRNIDTSLYFSQYAIPSCAGHGAAFSHKSSLLSAIGMGAPLVYESINPLYTWYLSKGRSMRGGQTISEMNEAINKIGHFLTADVGNDNKNIKQGFEHYADNAKQRQSAIIEIPGSNAELADNIRRCCKAGLGVNIGNSLAVSGTTVIDNVQIVTLSGTWYHATSFATWMKRNNQEYIFWVNSHGKIYTKATFGEPHDGAWMRPEKELLKFVKTTPGYGQPYAILPEALWTPSTHLKQEFNVPFPKGF
jgi:hypothetical protein